MLKSITKIVYVIIVVVGVSKKQVFFGKYKSRTYIGCRQFCIGRAAKLEYIFGIVL